MKKIILLLAMCAALTTQTLFAQVPSYVPTNGLVGYWPFNGNANDESGNGNNGVVDGAILTADRNGASNQSYSFNGIDSGIEITNTLLSNTVHSYSYNFWCSLDTEALTPNGYTIFDDCDSNQWYGKGRFGGNSNSFSQKLSFNFREAMSSESIDSNFNSNIWVNYCCVFDNENQLIKLFKNGVLVSTTNYIPNSYVSGDRKTQIGRCQSPIQYTPGTNFTSNWLGEIDDIGLWNRALTQQEITTLYNSSLPQTTCLPANVPTTGLVGYWPFCGNANDESANANNGTVNGAALTADRFGNINSAYSFDGVNDYIETLANNLPLNNSARSFSFFCDFQPTQSNNWNCILSYGNSLGTNNPGKINDLFVGSTNSSLIYLNNNVYTTTANANQNFSNIWHHIVVTYDGTSLNNIKIYFDGVQLQTTSQNFQNISILASTLSPLFFGKTSMSYSGINYFYNGKLDDIGIWNRALTPQEITNLYNVNQCITNITVTDTLIINVGQLSFNDPVTWANNITIFPNPASSQININFNNITNLNGGTLKIINSLGQEVATTPITTSGTNSTMQLATWGGTGMYFVQIINPQGQIVDIKKIILQ